MASSDMRPSVTADQDEEDVDQLVLWPHRSLSRNGTRLLLLAVGAVFACIAGWAVLAGAWPMLIYVVLAVGGFSLAVSHNHRVAHFAQVIELAPDVIRVSQVGPAARPLEPIEFNPFWVRIIEASGPWEEKRLLLRQSGRSIPIGDFLSPDERLQLAAELRDRIARRYLLAQPSQS